MAVLMFTLYGGTDIHFSTQSNIAVMISNLPLTIVYIINYVN